MKVQSISLAQKPTKKSFKGYVNGHYYSDEVILRAKEALNNPNWKNDLLKMKSSVINEVATWHEGLENQGGGLTRVLIGILSFGASEVLMDSAVALGTTISNASINKRINDIAKCLDDLRR